MVFNAALVVILIVVSLYLTQFTSSTTKVTPASFPHGTYPATYQAIDFTRSNWNTVRVFSSLILDFLLFLDFYFVISCGNDSIFLLFQCRSAYGIHSIQEDFAVVHFICRISLRWDNDLCSDFFDHHFFSSISLAEDIAEKD